MRRQGHDCHSNNVMKCLITNHILINTENQSFGFPLSQVFRCHSEQWEFLALKQYCHREELHQSRSDEEREKEVKLFLNNAFLFLKNKDRIMSDSRMFLCPVPIQNELAYTGTSGFHHPALGVYLEWWLNCENAMIHKEDETKWLVYFISGSPLSGANKCGIVNEKGDTDSKSILPFSPIWSNFIKINKRYDEAKSLYQAYTMEKVVRILRRFARQRWQFKLNPSFFYSARYAFKNFSAKLLGRMFRRASSGLNHW